MTINIDNKVCGQIIVYFLLKFTKTKVYKNLYHTLHWWILFGLNLPIFQFSKLPLAPLLQTSINYDKFLEKVICVKCKICKHLAESREEMILHLKSSHEEEIDGVNISSIEESKNEELSPENDITGKLSEI